MVHLVPEPEEGRWPWYPKVRTSISTRDYWKISTEKPAHKDGQKYLDALWHKDHTLEDVKRMRTRYHRNMLVYEACDEKELRRFCRLRGLKWRAPRGIGKYDNPTLRLRTNLETDDENWSFQKFLDFPAEMRVLVYEKLFDSFNLGKKHKMPPPPIAQVSQLLRKETLPIFYNDPPTELLLRSRLRPLIGGNVHFLKLVSRLEIRSSWGDSVTITPTSVEVEPHDGFAPQHVSMRILQQRAEAFLAVLKQRAGSRSDGSLGLEQSDAKILQKLFASEAASESI